MLHVLLSSEHSLSSMHCLLKADSYIPCFSPYNFLKCSRCYQRLQKSCLYSPCPFLPTLFSPLGLCRQALSLQAPKPLTQKNKEEASSALIFQFQQIL